MSLNIPNPEFLLLLLLLAPITYFYLRRPTFDERNVPAIHIWKVSSGGSKNPTRGKSLSHITEWLLACLFLLCVTLAASGLTLGTHQQEPRQIYVLLDNSTSMLRTTEASERRLFEKAREQGLEILSKLNHDDHWKLFSLSSSPSLLAAGTSPPSSPPEPLQTLTTAPMEGQRTLSFLRHLLAHPAPNSKTQVYLITDGNIPGLTELQNEFSPLRLLRIAPPTGNIAISDATLTRNWKHEPLSLRFELSNYSDSKKNVSVTSFPKSGNRRTIGLSAGSARTISIKLRSVTSDRLGIAVDSGDNFQADDRYYFYLPSPPPVPVFVVGRSIPFSFVQAAVESIGAPFYVATTDSLPPKQYKETNRLPIRNSIVISSGSGIPIRKDLMGWIHFGSPPETTGIQTTTTVQNPERVKMSPNAAIGGELSFGDLRIKSSQIIRPSSGNNGFLKAGEDWLAATTSNTNYPGLVFGFRLEHSNLAALPEFPLLLRNFFRNSLEQSDLLQIPTKQSVGSLIKSSGTPSTRIRHTVLTSSGIPEEAGTYNVPGNKPFVAEYPGWYEQTRGSTKILETVNLTSPEESKLNRNPKLSVSDTDEFPEITRQSSPTDLRRYLLALAVFFLLLHWVLKTKPTG